MSAEISLAGLPSRVSTPPDLQERGMGLLLSSLPPFLPPSLPLSLPFLQFDSHRTRHGFTPVGELEHCVHYKVGEWGSRARFCVLPSWSGRCP